MKPMLMALTATAIAGAAGADQAAPPPLSRYADRARVLVICAPTADDAELRGQDAVLGGQAFGLKAREVVVLRAVEPAAPGPQAEPIGAAKVCAAAGLPADRFGVALVGKDGGVKLRRRHPISTDELFRIIDAMPMRREEMRRTGPG